MKIILIVTLLAVLTVGSVYASTNNANERVIAYPRVVLYSAPWCTSCNAAKDYLTKNHIPFVKKDVSVDDKYLEEMSNRYKSRAVPVIVIGNDQKVLRGFVQEVFSKAFLEVLAANRQ